MPYQEQKKIKALPLELRLSTIFKAAGAALLRSKCLQMSNSSRTFYVRYCFKGTDNLSSRPDWKGQKQLGKISANRSRSWTPEPASCSPARRLSGSRQSSRRSWCSLSRPDTRRRSRALRGRARCCSSAAGKCRVWCSPCWEPSAGGNSTRAVFQIPSSGLTETLQNVLTQGEQWDLKCDKGVGAGTDGWSVVAE